MSMALVCQLLQLTSKELHEIGTTCLNDAVYTRILREANHKNFIVCCQDSVQCIGQNEGKKYALSLFYAICLQLTAA